MTICEQVNMSNDRSQAPSVSRLNRTWTEDSADVYSCSPPGGVQPAPITPSTPLVITRNSSEFTFDPPFPREEQANEYVSRILTSENEHSWICQQTLDLDSCSLNHAIELKTFSSIKIAESDPRFITPKKNRATVATLDLFEVSGDVFPNKPIHTAYAYSSNPKEGAVPVPVTPSTPYAFGRLFPAGGTDEYEYRREYRYISSPTLDFDSLVARYVLVEGDDGVFARPPLPYFTEIPFFSAAFVSPLTFRHCPMEKPAAAMKKNMCTAVYLDDVQQNVEKKCSTKEELETDVCGVRVSCMDVLYGRGGETNAHPGNITFRAEIKRKQESCQQTTNRKKKVEIARGILNTMKGNGSRFLKQAEANIWYLESDVRVLEKIKQALRENYTPEQQKAKRQKYRKK
jgi:hypothetical protein